MIYTTRANHSLLSVLDAVVHGAKGSLTVPVAFLVVGAAHRVGERCRGGGKINRGEESHTAVVYVGDIRLCAAF